jgi:HK97 family phage portal protein
MANGLIRRVLSSAAKLLPARTKSNGPWYLPVSGGWLSQEAGQWMNWWQMGYDIVPSSRPSAMVEACVRAYSQTIAQCPGDHWRATLKGGEMDGGREAVYTSALSRILRTPNDYQTFSDFMMNLVRSLYLEGNAYALALRNDRGEVDELHLMHPRECGARVAVNGEIFYALGGNPVIEKRLQMMGEDTLAIVPARDVLHIKLSSSRYDPLRGESPITAVAMEMAASDAIAAQQVAFYMNQARPSTVITTDLELTMEQIEFARQAWNQQSKGLQQGGTAILTQGLKPVTIATSARDSQMADVLKISDQRIAMAFGIPLQYFGQGGTPSGPTEALMLAWVKMGLGFALNHVETAFDGFFRLDGIPWEYTEFDTNALLRSAERERISAVKEAVTGGIFSPNEARARFDLPKVKFGDEPRMQQQQIPLSAAENIPALPGPSAPAPASVQPKPPPEKEEVPEKEYIYDADRVQSGIEALVDEGRDLARIG